MTLMRKVSICRMVVKLKWKLTRFAAYRLLPTDAGWDSSMTASWGSRPRLYADVCSAG
jgi:hypothetical protein